MDKSIFKEPRVIKTIALGIVIIFLMTVAAPIAAKPTTYQHAIDVIDNNKLQALSITTVVTASSFVMSSFGEDTGSPIAEELAELSTPLLLITCILFCEKFLITTFGAVSWGVLMPGSACLYILYIWTLRRRYREYAKKMILIALVCAFIIPTSAWLTNKIEDMFRYQIDHVFSEVHRLGDIFVQAEGVGDTNAFTSFFETLFNGIGQLFKIAKDLLSTLIDAIAILITTSCLIPLLTGFMLVWSIRSILHSKMMDVHETFTHILYEMRRTKETLDQIREKQNSEAFDEDKIA